MTSKKSTSLLKHIVIALFCIIINKQSYSQCNADFDWTIDSLAGKVQLTNTSDVPDTNIVTSYIWYSTPSNSVLSNIKNPLLKLPVGNDSVCLRIETVGCIDSVCYLISVPPVYCNAQFSFKVNDTIGSASFTNESVGDSLLYLWSFGDANTSSSVNPSHQYNSNGWYYVCLNISTPDSSCLNSECAFVRVNKSSPTPCISTFEYTYDTSNSRLIHFQNTTIGNPDITSLWILADDDVSTSNNPSYLFDTTGIFKVCLLVSGTNCADSICKLVEVIDILPSCNAQFDYQLFADSANQTKRIAVFNNTSAVDKPATYTWSFGDSTTSSEVSPIHYFGKNGVYKVCLTSQIGALCQDSTCTFITVKPDTNTSVIQANNVVTLLNVYPIPFNDVLTIECFSLYNKEMIFSIYNTFGQLLWVEERPITIGLNKILVNTEKLPKGVYLGEFKSLDNIQLLKVIK